MLRAVRIWIFIGVVAGALAALLVYLGIFNVAADAPHSALISAFIEAIRDRSIAARIKDIQVPPLDDTKLIATGAEHYQAMCIDCHLAPGVKQSELREGLYPQPPNLAERVGAGPAELFWVIKHGIKMSAMPAWGKTHDDRSIWSIVAFLRKLPELTPDQYHALIDVGNKADLNHTHPEKPSELRGEGTQHHHDHDVHGHAGQLR